MQVQLNNLLGLHCTDLRVSRDSIASCAGSINTKMAFKKLFQDLYQIGVRAEMIKEKEGEIFNIFQPHNTSTSGLIDDSNDADQNKIPGMVVSGQVDVSTILDQSQLQAVRNFFLYFIDRNTLIEN